MREPAKIKEIRIGSKIYEVKDGFTTLKDDKNVKQREV